MKKNILIPVLFVTALTSFSSTEVAENSCKLVNGTHESEQKRKQENQRHGTKHQKDDVDIINGLLSLLTIQLGDKNEKCT